MSGTSHDGVDLAACRFTLDPAGTWHYGIEVAETIPYAPDWRARLLALPSAPAEELAKTHTDLGHLLGLHVRQFCLQHDLQPQFVASHGHTIFHQPWRHFTHQIGCGETMVTHLTCPLVSDFRPRDVANGGQGAPLVPFSQYQLFPQAGLFLNIGGIANLSVFASRAGLDSSKQYDVWQKPGWQHLAYDLCAANLVLNHLAYQYDNRLTYDAAGAVAVSGELEPRLLLDLQALDFYHNHPPRSLGREYALSHIFPLLDASGATLPDQLHTYVHHIVWVLGQELDRFGIRDTQLLVTGGGAHNAFLMQVLDEMLAGRGITRIDPEPLLVDYAEALHFAFLGLCTLLRIPNVLYQATGARQSSILGAVHLPEGYGRVLV